MDMPATRIIAAGTNADTGYDSYRLGQFTFSRDEYFAHISWPKGNHIIEIDRFLRAMVRDIGWGFFYGWIFFDDIFGTTNHYGTVDIFAGAYDKGYKDQGIDHLETFPAEVVKEALETISQNWINEGYDPLSAPLETGSPLGSKTKERTDELVRGFRPAERMLGLRRRCAGPFGRHRPLDQPRLRRHGVRPAGHRMRAGLRRPAPCDQSVRPHRPGRRDLEPSLHRDHRREHLLRDQ